MKLSVLLLSYNYKHYIQQCIDSILSQRTNFDFEILVRDDGSNDGTESFVKEKYANESRVKVLDCSKNLGALDNILTLMDESTGEYVCHIDADDYLIDYDYFQRAVNFLDSNKDFNIFCGGYKYLENNNIYPENCWMVSPKKIITLEDLLSENYVSFCRVFRKLKVDRNIFGTIYPDWMLNFECLKNDKKAICDVDHCAGIYRIHNNSMFSKKTTEEKNKINDNIRVELRNKYNLYKSGLNSLNDIIVHIHLYLNKPNLEQIAYDNIKFIKECGFKILITSPKILPERFYDIIDIFYHDKENQLLIEKYTDIEVMYHYTKLPDLSLFLGVKELQKHGLAVLRSMIKGCDVASINNIKYIMRIEFDDIFGPKSIENIKRVINELKENNYDFDLIRNIYSYYTDISVHLMFYDCKKFLDVFGQIKNEDDYRKELCNLGICNKSTMLETFMYLMVEYYKNEKNLNIKYHVTSDIQSLYYDTNFNVHQNCFSLEDGILTDIAYVYVNGNLQNKLCLTSRNFAKEKAPLVQFYIVYKNGNNFTLYMNVETINSWSIHSIDDPNTIDHIYIKHGDKDFHKKYLIKIDEKNNNSLTILNLDTNESSWSKIEY
jgi:glycosyltransferase involved in cell wall biosynthesis